MSEQAIQSVNITMGQNVYTTFESLPNTISHALADFIDNALQSYKDNKDKLKEIDPNYKLHVDIDIIWSEKDDNRASKICILDNAAGINSEKYLKAFMPAIKPDDNSGLHEFGMGLKTAACWLGSIWSVKTKSFEENKERTIIFDLNDVTINDLKEIPVKTEIKENEEHYTLVEISRLTKNAPKKKSYNTIKTELASIYRKSLRENEMILTLCGENVTFTESEILIAPFWKTPDAEPIRWIKEIDFKFDKYKAKGFIAILKNQSTSKENRIVLLRRGRVIVGVESEGHYYSKAISGQAGSPRDKRIFGELELEGFDVAFNKNEIRDKENLEALLSALVSVIHTKDFDLTSQAQEYRPDERHKQVKKIITKHNTSAKKNQEPIEITTTTPKENITVASRTTTPTQTSTIASPSITDKPIEFIDEYDDAYKINGKDYKLNVQFVFDKQNLDLFWIDIASKSTGKIVCKINASHIFFEHFGNPNDSTIALLKALTIAKFTANEFGNGSASTIVANFNEYISKIKV